MQNLAPLAFYVCHKNQHHLNLLGADGLPSLSRVFTGFKRQRENFIADTNNKYPLVQK